jgi:hypothetical protein
MEYSRQEKWKEFKQLHNDKKIGITVALPVEGIVFFEEHVLDFEELNLIDRVRDPTSKDSFPFITFLIAMNDFKYGRINNTEEIIVFERIPWISFEKKSDLQQVISNKIQLQMYVPLSIVLDNYPHQNSFYGIVQEWNLWNTQNLAQSIALNFQIV